MRTTRSTRLLTLIVVGAAGIPGVSCSQTAEKSPTLETTASAATTPPPMTRPPDTGAVAQKPQRSTAVKRTPQKPARESLPKPRATATRLPAGEATPATPVVSPEEPRQDKWLSYDAGTNTVTFELIAGPFTYNGYRNGEGTLVVPSKANIVMNFVNKDGTPHSGILISGDGTVPNSATDPAIQRAYTNKVLEGLPQEASDVMRFPVPESGTYRIFCGVPGHGLSGMWIWLRIDPAAKAPSFGPTKG